MTEEEQRRYVREIAMIAYSDILHQAFCDLTSRPDCPPAFYRDAKAWFEKIQAARVLVQQFYPEPPNEGNET